MWNPFKTPLAQGATQQGQVASLPDPINTGEDQHFIFPSPPFEWGAWNPQSYQDASLPGGYIDDVQTDMYPSQFPESAGQSGVSHWNNPGLHTQADYSSIVAAPGSTDLAMPRDFGSYPGTNTFLRATGPVGGNGTVFSGYVAKTRSPQAGVNGPVTGGQDYANQLAGTAYAAAAQSYSQAAAVSALVSAV